MGDESAVVQTATKNPITHIAQDAAAGRTRANPFRFAVVRVISSVLLLWFLLSKVSSQELLSFFQQTADNWPMILLALAMPGVGVIISSLRLICLLQAQGMHLSLPTACKLNIVSAFYNQILPSTIGGDVFRTVFISRMKFDGKPLEGTSGSLLLSVTVIGVDRVVGVLGILVTGIIAAAIMPNVLQKASGLERALPIAVAISLLFGLLPFIPGRSLGRWFFSIAWINKLRSKAITIYGALKAYRASLKNLFLAFLLSIGLQITIILEYWILARAFQIDVSLWGFAILCPVVTMISMIPITINGIGLRENALHALGAPLGMTAVGSVALGWGFLIVKIAWALSGAIIHFWVKSPTVASK